MTGTTGGATLDASGAGTVKYTSATMGTPGGGSKTLTLTGTNTGDNTLAGTVADNSVTNITSMSKTGAGTWILTGSSTNSGSTTVTAGTLLANNSSGSATGSGNVTVNGGTFGGSGAVSGTVTINAGATLAPGSSIESLGTGTVTFNATNLAMSILKYEISPTNGDLVNAVGVKPSGGFLNIADPSTTLGTKLDIVGSNVPTGNKYTVAIYDGKSDGSGWNGFRFNNDVGGYVYLPGTRQFLIRYNDTNPGGNFLSEATAATNANANSRFVTLVAVPEAGSFVTMGLIGCCAWVAARFGKRYGFKSIGL
jgi:autotransporter-associated beta strand protein